MKRITLVTTKARRPSTQQFEDVTWGGINIVDRLTGNIITVIDTLSATNSTQAYNILEGKVFMSSDLTTYTPIAIANYNTVGAYYANSSGEQLGGLNTNLNSWGGYLFKDKINFDKNNYLIKTKNVFSTWVNIDYIIDILPDEAVTWTNNVPTVDLTKAVSSISVRIPGADNGKTMYIEYNNAAYGEYYIHLRAKSSGGNEGICGEFKFIGV